MDLILGGYVDYHVDTMSHTELDDLEVLMDVLDRDLFKWFTGEAPVPGDHDTALFRKICAWHKIELTL